MTGIRDVIQARQEASKRFAKYRDVRKGILINIDAIDSTKVSGRPGYNWVMEDGQNGGVFPCFNVGVQDRVGLPVLVGIETREPFRRTVMSIDWGMVPFIIPPGDDDPGDYDIKPHAASHEWPDNDPGPDVVSVFQRAIVPLRLQYVQDLIVFVNPGIWFADGNIEKFGGQYVDLTSYVPSTNSDPLLTNVKIVLVYIDTDFNFARVKNQTAVILEDENPSYDDPPAEDIPVAWVYIEQGDTILTDSDITDARPFYTSSLSVENIMANSDFLNAQLAIEHHLDIEITRHQVEG